MAMADRFSDLIKMRSAEMRRDRCARGFTMIEVLIVIAIASLLAMVAIPSLQDMIQRNRVSGEVNSFIGDVQFARAQAIKTGQPVTICVSSNGSTCLGVNTWYSGWIVFTDVNGSATMDDPKDVVLRTRATFSGSDSFSAAPARTAITYGRTGFASGIPATGVTLKITTTPANTAAVRCIYLDLIGHQSSGKLGDALSSTVTCS